MNLSNYIKRIIYLIVAIWFSSAVAGSYEDWFRAIRRDNVGGIAELLRRGFEVNTLDENGVHGLFISLREENFKVAELLADYPRTRVEWRSDKDESALMLASLKGNMSVVRKLIARDADINKPGWTPLHYAATNGHVEIMRLLLEKHAFIDAQSPNGTTPLMMAAFYGTAEAVKLLLDEGADALMRNEQGLSALDFAYRGPRPDSIRLIAAAMRQQAARQNIPLRLPPPPAEPKDVLPAPARF